MKVMRTPLSADMLRKRVTQSISSEMQLHAFFLMKIEKLL